jgi:molybdopterin synthase sulfur carrier subunit
MSVTVRIPSPLRPVTGGLGELKVEGATVGDVLRKIDAQYAGFAARVFDENGVKRFINVYVNEDNVRDKKNLDTEVKPGDTISILPSIAGGSCSGDLSSGASRHLLPAGEGSICK